MKRKPNARQRILDTASELFTERGYGAVGINEIIEKSETAKASFYHHFPSKEQLCVSWLDQTHCRAVARHDEILESKELGPKEKIDAYFVALAEWLQSQDYRGCPYTNTAAVASQEAIHDQVKGHKESIREFLRKLAKALADDTEGDEIGDALFLLYSGATVESQNLRTVWPVEAARKTARRLCELAEDSSGGKDKD